jgi:cell division protein FtsQ
MTYAELVQWLVDDALRERGGDVTQRATRGKPARRGTVNARKKPARRPNRPGMLDQAIAALPVSEATLHKVAAWSILGFAGVVALGIAAWFGVPGAMGVALAEGVGRAGFQLERVNITGAHHMDSWAIRAIAFDQKSRAMPLVDLEKIRQRLLAYGWVADARVSRQLPNALAIDIVERTPAAVWQDHGQLMLIDANGVPLEAVNPDAIPDLPRLIGDNANGQELAYRTLLDAAPALKPLVKAATWVGNRRWDLMFNTGEKLMLPEGDDAATKALVQFAKWDGTQRLLGRGYVHIDMRNYPNRTTVLSGTGSAGSAALSASGSPVENTEDAQ